MLAYWLGRRFFSSTIGLIAAVFYAFYAPAVFFEGEMLDIFLMVLFAPAILLMAQKVYLNPSIVGAILLGLLLGLAAITRPSILLFIPVLLIILYVALIPKQLPGARAAQIGLTLLGMLVVIAPVTIRNAIVGSGFMPIASYGGINFYIGNGPAATGYSSQTPRRYLSFGRYEDSVELFARKEVEILSGKKPTAAQVNSYWFRKALKHIYSQPVSFFNLLWKKLALFWNAFEIKNNKNIYVVAEYSFPLRILLTIFNFGILAPLAILGIILTLIYKRDFNTILLSSFVAVYCLAVILFFVCGRFRLPVIIPVLTFAAYSITRLYEALKLGKIKWLAYYLPALAVISFLVNANWYGIRNQNFARDYWTVGNCWLEKGELNKAETAYLKALSLDPQLTDALNNLGEVYYRQHKLDEAQQRFARAIELDPEYYKSYNNLGVCLEAKGELKQAIEYYRKTLAIVPDHLLARHNLAEALIKKGDLPEAIKMAESIINLNPQYAPAYLTLAKSYRQSNQPDKVEINLRQAWKLGSKALRNEIKTHFPEFDVDLLSQSIKSK